MNNSLSFGLMARWLFLMMGLFLISCSDRPLMNESVSIRNEEWAITEPIQFKFEIKDTAQEFDVFVSFRHTTDYKWMNCFLFLKTFYPNQEFSRDTLELILADEKTGKWFGEGSSQIKNYQMLFKSHVKFPIPGFYHLEFTQGMREDKIRGIMDLGLKVIPVSKK